MKEIDSLRSLSPFLRKFILILVLTLDMGYAAGFKMLQNRSELSVKGVQEQILGNEDDEEATEFKYMMSENQLYGLIHSHVMGLAPVFFLIGMLFYFTRFKQRIKMLISSELLLSLITTFGGLWLLWKGFDWAVYLVMISGGLMHLGFAIASLGILADILMAHAPSRAQSPN